MAPDNFSIRTRFRRVWRPALAVLMALAAGACQPAPPAAEGSAAAPVITLDELRTAAYPSDLLDGSMVRLANGVFPPADSIGEPLAALELAEPIAASEPGAEVARAAVVVRESGGGTGTFSWLHLLERRDGPPRVVASGYLGDRIELMALRLIGDTIEVRLVTQGPTDALCCPTLEVRKRLIQSGKDLVEAGEG
jgi:hypothetical protein